MVNPYHCIISSSSLVDHFCVRDGRGVLHADHVSGVSGCGVPVARVYRGCVVKRGIPVDDAPGPILSDILAKTAETLLIYQCYFAVLTG